MTVAQLSKRYQT